MAVVVAILATVIGTTAAFALVRGGTRFAGTGRLLFTLPIMIPGVLIGIGLLIFVRRALNLQLGLHTVVAGHLVFTTSFVVLIVAARLQGFDRRLEWAAADLGANRVQTLRHIVLPLIAPAIIAGALLSVTLSIDEFVDHVLHDRAAADPAALHLHPDQVRGHPRGQRAGDGHPGRHPGASSRSARSC